VSGPETDTCGTVSFFICRGLVPIGYGKRGTPTFPGVGIAEPPSSPLPFRDFQLSSVTLHIFEYVVFTPNRLYLLILNAPANDLRSILRELLALGSARSIPNPTSRRTWTLVVWILSVQNLPSVVLLPAKGEIVSVLKRALEGQIGTEQAKSDGLKVVNPLRLLIASSYSGQRLQPNF
jgi:hypothetical protein